MTRFLPTAMRRLALGAGASLALLGMTTQAQAGNNISWSIGVSSGSPYYQPPHVAVNVGSGYHRPPPVYVAPPSPVYVVPPVPVYLAPAPVYVAPPVYHRPRQLHHHRQPSHHHGRRHDRR
ncbi:hypothetical protein [Corticibacter populi]|nr:hypothetical protein [Corticibacter populi]RZS33612.1 hypothetical protein EV687_1937 [Corticibacter populi]